LYTKDHLLDHLGLLDDKVLDLFVQGIRSTEDDVTFTKIMGNKKALGLLLKGLIFNEYKAVSAQAKSCREEVPVDVDAV
jgi:hypothetical protein